MASTNINDLTLIAFDTETSGPYPIESEIIELGAVKWKNGEVVGQFQTLLKPSKPLVPENIRIHGITNEMVADAALMSNEIVKFCDFIQDSVLIAHHAPFDLGFLVPAIEKAGLVMPKITPLCSSLISRKLLPTTNHKLQTLIKELKLVGGEAHRAYDDAYACLQVMFKCFEKLEKPVTLERLLQIQEKSILPKNYFLYTGVDLKIKTLVEACEKQKSIQIVYEGGQTKGKARPIKPMGIVRNPDGDYIHAECGLDLQRKRFYLDKILDFDLS